MPQILRLWAFLAAILLTVTAPYCEEHPLVYIDTHFENASPLDWEIDAEGAVHINLHYDHERNSPNRAAGHWYFLVEGKLGSTLTLILQNVDNIWNGRQASVAQEDTIAWKSLDHETWIPFDTEFIEGNKLRFDLTMEQEKIYIARAIPYCLSDLASFLQSIQTHPQVEIETIGKTVEGRPLEMVRVGNPTAPHRVLIRARAHAWEPGGNWVLHGLIQALLRDDPRNERFLERFCLYTLPMANKDGVARGLTRFNMLGKDLNRNWDQPADPILAPENAALEAWLERMVRAGHKPDLAIDLHNDQGGNLHISRPNVQLETYLANMKRFESLLYKYTWFREGATGGNFRNPGTLGEGWVERYGVDACILELNTNWIKGLNDVPSSQNWERMGDMLRDVFYAYFEEHN
jgi:hypothetical protein